MKHSKMVYPLPSVATNVFLRSKMKLLDSSVMRQHGGKRILPCRFEVYPTPDGEIAIDAPGGYGQSVILYCKAEGGALCLVNIGGKHRHAGYSHASYLPDNFLRDALAELTFETDK